MTRSAKRGGAVVGALSLIVVLGGCGVERKWGSATTWGALGGAAVGGAAGAGIEAGRGMDDAGQLGRGAAIGIAVGTVAGGLAGHFLFDPVVEPPPPPPPPPERPPAVDRTIVIQFDQVRFGFGASTVEARFHVALDKVTGELVAEPGTRIVVEGHTDDVGGEAYGWLLSDHGAPGSAGRPDGASIRTGRERGGWRLLLRIPPGAVIRKGVLAEGVEFMGDGGSAIMPPSRHVTGRRYTWADTIPPDGLPELAPAWVTLMAPRPAPTTSRAPVSPADFEGIGTPYGMAALRDEVELLAAAEKGTRNHRLNRAAFAVGSLAAAGHLDLEQAIAEVCRVAKAIGLGDEEIRATAKSGAEAGMRSPRTAA